ncbi:complement factor H-like [Arapaima gigas]
MSHLSNTSSTWLFIWLLLSRYTAGEKGQCPKPEIDSNVILTNEDLLKNKFPEGSTATFDCAVGYMRDGGSATISCTDGMWSSLSLKCKKISCSSPGEIVNGRFDLSAGTEYGAVIRAVCDKGYEPEGPSYMKCTDKGWSGQNPTCKVITCDHPPEIENGRVSKPPRTFPGYGDVIEYSCSKNGSVWKTQIVCNEYGEYEPSVPSCEVVMCPKPEGRSDVILKEEDLLTAHFPEGSSVTFECAEGYERKWGSAHISCINGNWTELTLKCQKKSCGFPGHVLNGVFDLTDGVEFGAVIKVVCNKGYKMVGTGSLSCTANGWIGTIPSCEVFKCPEPPDIENGRVALKPFNKQFPEYSDKVVYSCQEGYNIIGSAVIECKENGQYVPSPPQCKDAGRRGPRRNSRDLLLYFRFRCERRFRCPGRCGYKHAYGGSCCLKVEGLQ